MVSILNQFVGEFNNDFNKKHKSIIEFKIGKQISSRSWELEENNPASSSPSSFSKSKDQVQNQVQNQEKKKLIIKVNTHLKSKIPIVDSFKFYKDLLEKTEEKNYFVGYLFQYSNNKSIYTILEFCSNGDLNSYLIEYRYKGKSDNEVQVLKWLNHLLNAVEFLDKNKYIHKRINTYNIYVQNEQLKLNGLEYVEALNGGSIKLSNDELYGMFNAPEICSYNKINPKYHIWSLGWVFYEMTTCEWQHFKLYNEDFKNEWKSPNLSNTYSKDTNRFYRKMLREEPKKRISTSKIKTEISNLIQLAENKSLKKENTSSSIKGSSFLNSFIKRFVINEPNIDEDRDVSDSDDERTNYEELKVLPELQKYNFGNYKAKTLLKLNSENSIEDFLVVQSKIRYHLRRINDDMYSDATIKDIKKILDSIKDNKCTLIVTYQEYIMIDKKCLIISEYFEDGHLEKLIATMKKSNRNFSEDKVFDYTYYLAEATKYLHHNKIIHKDIQPKNIFVRNDRIKLGNFGLEPFVTQSLTNLRKKSSPNSICYMSPELINNYYHESSDIWAIGCVIYEMYTLKTAFTVENIHNLNQTPDIEASPKIKSIYKNLTKLPYTDRLKADKIVENLMKTISSEKAMIESLER